MENSFKFKTSVKKSKFSLIGGHFYELFEKNGFNNPINHIDKTLLIYELLKNNNKAILINRPRRFGKTFNMDMLNCFFHPEQNEVKKKKIQKIFEQLNIYKEAFPDIEAIYDLISLALEKLDIDNIEPYIEIAQKEKISLSIEIENILKNGEKKKILI